MARQKATKKRTAKKPASRPKRWFIPYPLIIFLLICSGVFLVAWSLKANAGDVLVNAIVKGQPITDPAVITSPANGAHFAAVPISVSGTCPTNAAYIEIFRNNFMSGSAPCTGSGSGGFELQIDLFPGRNDLTAHSFNVTDEEGPVSNLVSVYYDAPAPVQTTNLLTLKTAFIYKGYYVNQPVDWPLEISGGSSPYAFNIDWGDGTNSVISRKDAGQFKINHTYLKPGGYKGSYKIKVQASDTDGNYAYSEFFIIVNAKDSSVPIGSIYSKPPPSLGGLGAWLWVAWPAYVSTFLMVVGYKLGEREELLILRKRGQLRSS